MTDPLEHQLDEIHELMAQHLAHDRRDVCWTSGARLVLDDDIPTARRHGLLPPLDQHGGKDCCGGFPKPGCCTPGSPPRQILLPPLRDIVHQHRDDDCCRVGACCNVPDV